MFLSGSTLIASVACMCWRIVGRPATASRCPSACEDLVLPGRFFADQHGDPAYTTTVAALDQQIPFSLIRAAWLHKTRRVLHPMTLG